MRGKVIATIGGVYKVRIDAERCYDVKPLGVLKHRRIQIVVGDEAEIDPSDFTLKEIYPRKNLLVRPRIANLDLGVVVISADKPQFSSYLLDKFLTLLRFSGVAPLVVLSKSDLIDAKAISRIVEQYRRLEIEVIPYSQNEENSFAEIVGRIEGKTVAFISGIAVFQGRFSALFSSLRPALSFVPLRQLPAPKRAGLQSQGDGSSRRDGRRELPQLPDAFRRIAA